tara:strand:- start:2412 stop:3170 length:759 start_codon:yes stop_codon:yes gene_type:complete
MKQTYFPHDSNARNDIKIIKLRQSLGLEGYGIYFCLLEMLFADKNMLCVDDYDTLAFALHCEPEKLKAVINDFDLFEVDGNCFYSARLNETIGEIIKKSVNARKNAEKRWNKPNNMQSHSNGNAIKLNKSKEDDIKLDKRITLFKTEINSFEQFNKDDKENFFLYWSELNKSKTRMRWELERTWDLKRRLQRWSNSQFNNINKQTKFPDWYDEYTYKKLDNDGRKKYEEHLKSLGWESKYAPSVGMVWNKKK